MRELRQLGHRAGAFLELREGGDDRREQEGGGKEDGRNRGEDDGAGSNHDDDTPGKVRHCPHLPGGQPVQTGRSIPIIALTAQAMAGDEQKALANGCNDYLAKPMLADPLRALDCCLVNDGGVAIVMTSLERARHLRRAPVRVAHSSCV